MADDMDKEFEEAVGADWTADKATGETIATLVSHVSIWRSRANYWRGRCEGMAETVAYLKARLESLEGPGSGQAERWANITGYLEGGLSAFKAMQSKGDETEEPGE